MRRVAGSAVVALTVASWLSVLAVSGGSMPVAAQDDIVTHFKYGSVGTEGTVGIPYPIWRVLPVVFADKLPNRPGQGYERLGEASLLTDCAEDCQALVAQRAGPGDIPSEDRQV